MPETILIMIGNISVLYRKGYRRHRKQITLAENPEEGSIRSETDH